jgi:hypothetical protein
LTGGHDPQNFVTIVDSVLTNNASDGLFVNNPSAGATAWLAGSDVTGNGTGVSIGSSFTSRVFSYGDNEINNNGTDVTGTLTPVAKR